MSGGRILDNIMMLPVDDTPGDGIYLEANATRWTVAGNKANDATVAAITNNPYLDVGNLNAWYDNQIGGGTVTAPA
jgi:hypothetical protein